MTQSYEAPPKVFISYSHDSPEHLDRVWDLCEQFRQDGIDCRIDQHETSPPKGWPRWCRDQVKDCDFVLVVCTETYNRRFEGKEEARKGLGGGWEAFIITQELYEAAAQNTKFIPVVFSKDDKEHIPTELRGATRHDLSSNSGYEDLFRRLSDQPAKQKSEVGLLRRMPSQPRLERRPEFGGPIWVVPIPANPFFTGRGKVLEDLEDALRSAGVAALTGFGGAGKTQTAARYAYLRRGSYSGVLWAAASSRETLVSEFVAISSRMGLPQMKAEETVAEVKHWLDTHENWLLILDNAENLSFLGEFLPALPRGHVLLTTQAQATGTTAPRIEIPDMAPDEGGFLLLRRAKLVSPETGVQEVPTELAESAQELSRELGGLPLALDQAGAFVEETACGLPTYLRLYRESRAKLLRRRGTSAADHPDSVAATFALSFEKVENASPAGADILRLCSFLNSDAIPEEIFASSAKGLGPNLEPILTDALRFNEAVGCVLRYSLLRRDPAGKTLTIHRLVQAVLQDHMTSDERRQSADRAVRAVGAIFPKSDFANWPACERLIRHAEVCASLIRNYELTSPDSARLLNQAATYLIERARYSEAEDLLERAARIADTIAELRPEFLAVALNNLAAVYHAIDKYDLAEKVNKQVLEIREAALGPDHPEVARSLNNLATVYMAQGRHREAKALLVRALAIKQKVLDPKDPEIATTLNNLGGVHEALAEYTQAEEAFKGALTIRTEVLAPDDPDVALTRVNLAQLYHVMERYPEAKELQPSAEDLKVLTGSLGQEHPTISTTLNNCGLLYQALGDLETAERCYERAKEIDGKILGKRSRSYAVAVSNLAALYLERKQYTKAESLFSEALGILTETLGPDHLDRARVLSGLGRTYLEQGRLDKAAKLSKESFQIRLMALGRQHPDVALAQINLARMYQAQGRLNIAFETSRKAWRVFKKAYGPFHPSVAECCETRADTSRAMGRDAAARIWHERANAVRMRSAQDSQGSQ